MALAAEAVGESDCSAGIRSSPGLPRQYPRSTSTTLAGKAAPPLERFRVAKERISGLFHNLSCMMEDVASRLFRQVDAEGTSDELHCIVHKARKEVEVDQMRVVNASEKVRSNQMKVAFFGRTSNGKSSVINAMLGCRILPVGIGHTTSCFCSVQGTLENSAFLELPGSDARKDVEVRKSTNKNHPLNAELLLLS